MSGGGMTRAAAAAELPGIRKEIATLSRVSRRKGGGEGFTQSQAKRELARLKAREKKLTAARGGGEFGRGARRGARR